MLNIETTVNFYTGFYQKCNFSYHVVKTAATGLTPEAFNWFPPSPVSVRFQSSLHAIIIQPHCEPHPRATYIKTDIDNLYSVRDLRSVISSHSAIPMDIDPARRNKKPRLLLETEREKLDEFVDSIHYSARYNDDKFEYRHVQLPKNMLKKIPTDYFDSSKGTLKLLWEEEWRALGITQSLGWEHYEVHEPEPHILLFKRPLNYQPPLQQ
ncbi:unnamed protein product [Penicillium nalgiovense]|nr:unnamed protein product [Penicillium nalgiovense]